MKKFISGLFLVLLTVLLSVVCTLAIQTYVLPIQTDDERVWEIANLAIEDAQNPTFTSVDESMAYYEQLVDGEITDSFIVSIPRETYKQISTVVIGREGKCVRKDILSEYLRNYNPVYQYLAPDEPQNNDEIQVGDQKAVKVNPDTLPKSDTVINGQLYKVQRE